MMVLTCPLCCHSTFPNTAALKVHLENIAINFSCPACNISCQDIQSLIKHLGECPNKTFNAANDGNGIEKNYASDNNVIEDEYSCTSCNVKFKCVKQHMRECHSGQGFRLEDDDKFEEHDSDGDKSITLKVIKREKYFCIVCDVPVDSVEKHREEFHALDDVFIRKNIEEDVLFPNLRKSEADLECDQCQKKFECKDTLMVHLESHELQSVKRGRGRPPKSGKDDSSTVHAVKKRAKILETSAARSSNRERQENSYLKGFVTDRRLGGNLETGGESLLKNLLARKGSDREQETLPNPIPPAGLPEQPVKRGRGRPRKAKPGDVLILEKRNEGDPLGMRLPPNGSPSARKKCHYCNETLANRTHFMEHLRLHRGDANRGENANNTFMCDDCGAQFTNFNKYNIHLHNHSKDYQYWCKSTFNLHVKKHPNQDIRNKGDNDNAAASTTMTTNTAPSYQPMQNHSQGVSFTNYDSNMQQPIYENHSTPSMDDSSYSSYMTQNSNWSMDQNQTDNSMSFQSNGEMSYATFDMSMSPGPMVVEYVTPDSLALQEGFPNQDS